MLFADGSTSPMNLIVSSASGESLVGDLVFTVRLRDSIGCFGLCDFLEIDFIWQFVSHNP